jgi:hypothetical protein
MNEDGQVLAWSIDSSSGASILVTCISFQANKPY